MKIWHLLIFLILLFPGCKEPANKTVNNEVVVGAHPWFTSEKITESAWRISDNGEDNIYLVTGRDSALLIDNGMGAVDILQYVRRITKLPLIIINTHAHPDHVGSRNQFDFVYAHPDDFEAISHYTNPGVQKEMLSYMVQTPVADSLKFVPVDTLYSAPLRPVSDGQVFNLGDRKIEVIHTPGHTKGSICLLDVKDKLLFTGDHIKELAWLHMEESMPLETYLQSLRKIQSRAGEFERLLPGHDSTLNNDFLAEQIICAENIISGKCTGAKYESIVGEGLICTYKRARIAYTPGRIKSRN